MVTDLKFDSPEQVNTYFDCVVEDIKKDYLRKLEDIELNRRNHLLKFKEQIKPLEVITV